MEGMSHPPQPSPQPWVQAPPPRRPRHPEAKLGGFSVMDWVTFAVYVGLMFVLPFGLVVFLGDAPAPAQAELDAPSTQWANFILNLAMYAIVFVLVLVSLGRELWRSFRSYLWYPWAKYLGVPGGWLATIIVSAALVAVYAAATGQSMDALAESQNQEAADALIAAIPFPLMALMLVIMGPLVEEFVFRHLLIGKLSRWVNKWLLVAVSSVAFMSLHFIGKEWPTLGTAAPYLVMGLSFGTAYVLSGKSIAYSWSVHAFSNLIALSLSVFLGPYLPSGS